MQRLYRYSGRATDKQHDQRHAGYTAGREAMIEHDEIHRGGHNWNQVEEAENVY